VDSSFHTYPVHIVPDMLCILPERRKKVRFWNR
jgi:hypothetical protein